MYNAAASESAGEWYLGVYCRKCQAPIPVFQDPGRGTAIAAGSGKLTVACPRCGKKAQYAAREVITFLVYADKPASAGHAPVNDDHPIERESGQPGSQKPGSQMPEPPMSESEPVLDLAPYEILDEVPDPEAEPEVEAGTDAAPMADADDVLEFDGTETEDALELDALEPLELDIPEPTSRRPATGERPVAEPVVPATPASADSSTPAAAAEEILELGAYELSEPEAEPGIEAEAAPESETAADSEAAAEPVVEAAPTTEPQSTDPQSTKPHLDVLPETTEPAASDAPVGEISALELREETAAGDDPPAAPSLPAEPEPVLELGSPDISEPEPAAATEPAPEPVSEAEPVPPPDLSFALQLQAFFDAAPETAPVPEPQADTPELAEPASSATRAPDERAPEPPAGGDRPTDLDQSVPALEPEPEPPEPEPIVDRALEPPPEPEPVVDSLPAADTESVAGPPPALELAPAIELTGAADEPKIVEPQILAETRDTAPPEPAPDLGPPEPAAPPLIAEPALELDPPEPVPDLESEPTPEIARARDVGEAPAPEADPSLELEAFFADHTEPSQEQTPAADAAAPAPDMTEPDTGEPAADESLKNFFDSLPLDEPVSTADIPAFIPDTTEPAADESLEAFFDSRPVPTPAAPTPAAEESLEAFFESRPVHVPETAAPVAAAPAAPEPPPAPPPVAAAPKSISQIYRERWAEPALRPRVIVELRPILHSLRGRAEVERDDIVIRVADLFLDYLDAVTPERQSAAAIEQYINAVFTLAGRKRNSGTDRVGEQIAASLRALNRHAGLYTHH